MRARLARSAADADTLVTCGALSTSLEQLADRVYDAMPAPRARTRVLEPEEAPVALDEAVAALRDLDAQRTAAAQRHETAAARELLSGGDEDGIAGLPMAEQAEDRDGLMLDQLHLRLGPVLPDWPAGLIVDVAVQGDVIQEATVDVVPPAPGAYHGPAFWDAGATASEAERRRRTAAAHLDSAARLLGVAGWADAAFDARRLRDATLDGAPPVDRVRRLRRRVERSRTLRWSLSGLGVLDHDDAVARGVEGPARRAGGDVHDRLRQWLTEAEEALSTAPCRARARAGRPASGPRRPCSRPSPTSSVGSIWAPHASSWRASIPTSTSSSTHGGSWPVVEQTPVWAALAVPVVLGLLVAFAACLDAGYAAVSEGHGVSARALAAPFRQATRLLLQQRRTTLHPDALVWRIGSGALIVIAALMLAVVPLGHWIASDLAVGVVWFNAMDVQLWALVWLAGWGANAPLSLVGGYRFLAQALAYELPLMFAITAPAIGARSLSVGTIVAAQHSVWFVVWMPVAFVAFLVAVAGFSQWGPFSHPVHEDVAGGVASELSGADRLLHLVGRYALLAAGAAFATALFLGAGRGPLLPDWLWSTLKTLAVLAVLVHVRRRLPTLRMDRFTEVGWIVLLPATLLQMLVVSVLVLTGVI
jgi:NADH-quinone oxidoreductase subunit H